MKRLVFFVFGAFILIISVVLLIFTLYSLFSSLTQYFNLIGETSDWINQYRWSQHGSFLSGIFSPFIGILTVFVLAFQLIFLKKQRDLMVNQTQIAKDQCSLMGKQASISNDQTILLNQQTQLIEKQYKLANSEFNFNRANKRLEREEQSLENFLIAMQEQLTKAIKPNDLAELKKLEAFNILDPEPSTVKELCLSILLISLDKKDLSTELIRQRNRKITEVVIKSHFDVAGTWSEILLLMGYLSRNKNADYQRVANSFKSRLFVVFGTYLLVVLDFVAKKHYQGKGVLKDSDYVFLEGFQEHTGNLVYEKEK